MHRLLVSSVVAAVVLGGCAAGGDEAILVLSDVLADTSCATTASGTQTVLSHGTLDVVLESSGYLFFADLKSRITALDGQEDQRTIIVTGANVDVTFPGSTLFSAAELADLKAKNFTHFFESFSTAIAPAGTATAPFILIPQGLVDQITTKADLSKEFRLEALGTFTVLGNMSGEKVQSQEFSYGVTIGNFVTVRDNGACANLASGFVAKTGYACNPAQDGTIDCCTSGGALVCPAVAPSS